MNTDTGSACGRISAAALLKIAGLLLMGLLLLNLSPRVSAADTNTIQSLTAVTAPAGNSVEVTLTSTRPFDVRDDVLTLQIGTATFDESRYLSDDSLNTVIFTLTPAQYAATKTGDAVIVYYGSGSPSDSNAWNFGTLNKSLLK